MAYVVMAAPFILNIGWPDYSCCLSSYGLYSYGRTLHLEHRLAGFHVLHTWLYTYQCTRLCTCLCTYLYTCLCTCIYTCPHTCPLCTIHVCVQVQPGFSYRRHFMRRSYTVMVFMVMACIFMICVGMAYIAVAYIAMAYLD